MLIIDSITITSKQLHLLLDAIHNKENLPTVDEAALLSQICEVFKSPKQCEESLIRVSQEMIQNGLLFENSHLSRKDKNWLVRQLICIGKVVQQELHKHGLLSGETFPYSFNRVVHDTLLLTKSL